MFSSQYRPHIHTAQAFSMSSHGTLALAQTMLTVFEVKFTGSLGRPESHGVNDVVPVARNRSVIGQSQNHLGGNNKNRNHYSGSSVALCSELKCDLRESKWDHSEKRLKLSTIRTELPLNLYLYTNSEFQSFQKPMCHISKIQTFQQSCCDGALKCNFI